MCFKKRDKIRPGDLRFNYSHGHLAHVKDVYKEDGVIKAKSVFISSKRFDGSVENIMMNKPINICTKNKKKVKYGYFIKRVRTYPKSSYSRKINKRLSRKDKFLSNDIYRMHLKNKR